MNEESVGIVEIKYAIIPTDSPIFTDFPVARFLP